MGDHDHRNFFLAADIADQRADPGLAWYVQTLQRLVKQQQLGSAKQRLRDQQPLLFASGAPTDRPSRVICCPHQLDHIPEASTPVGGTLRSDKSSQPRKRRSPPSAVQPEGDDVDSPDAQAGVERFSLRHVTDAAVLAAGPRPQHLHRAARRGEAQQDPHERRLSRTIRSEHGDEFACSDVEVDARPDRSPAEHGRGAAHTDRNRVSGR